jgi:hypothetical protein
MFKKLNLIQSPYQMSDDETWPMTIHVHEGGCEDKEAGINLIVFSKAWQFKGESFSLTAVRFPWRT